MLRASGALEALAGLLAPALEKAGLPPQVLPLMLLRPFSGSGALAAGADLLQAYGPDSRTGRVASVMLSSTETTFYVLAVYFGQGKGKWARRAVPAALAADLTGFLLAAWTVELLG